MNFDNTATNSHDAGVDHFFAALDAAYAKARGAHEAETCSASEWSCSYCEGEQL